MPGCDIKLYILFLLTSAFVINIFYYVRVEKNFEKENLQPADLPLTNSETEKNN